MPQQISLLFPDIFSLVFSFYWSSFFPLNFFFTLSLKAADRPSVFLQCHVHVCVYVMLSAGFTVSRYLCCHTSGTFILSVRLPAFLLVHD